MCVCIHIYIYIYRQIYICIYIYIILIYIYIAATMSMRTSRLKNCTLVPWPQALSLDSAFAPAWVAFGRSDFDGLEQEREGWLKILFWLRRLQAKPSWKYRVAFRFYDLGPRFQRYAS